MPTAIIQARMGSTRLPGKLMLPLLGKPALSHVVERVARAKLVNKVIVATTLNPGDDVVEEFCKDNGILVFRGSESDVLDRYYQCAKLYGVQDIVRITADCPLHDPAVIDMVINEYINGEYDYVTNAIEYTFPKGLDVEVFSFQALKTSAEKAKLPSEREHVTAYIWNDEIFRKKNVSATKKYPIYRLTLDYLEDYELIKKIYKGIGKQFFSLDEVMEFLSRNPHLVKINQSVNAPSYVDEGYIKSLVCDAKNILIPGNGIYLRALTEEDASQEYCDWINNPEVNRFLESKKTTVQELKQFIKEKKKNPNCLLLGIFIEGSGKHVGSIILEPIDPKSKKATIDIMSGDKNLWGTGMCTKAIKLLVNYAIKKLKLKKIDLGVISENKVAIKCYEKAGFKIDRIEYATDDNNRTFERIIMSIKEGYESKVGEES